MFSFKHLINKLIDTVQVQKDQVIFDGSSEYLYFDTQEGNEVVRHAVHAPTTAEATEYDNSVTSLTSTDMQGVVTELLTYIGAQAPTVVVTQEGCLSYDDRLMQMVIDASGNLEYTSAIYDFSVDDNGNLLYEPKNFSS